VKRIVPVIAGPFPTRWETYWHAIRVLSRWPGKNNVRFVRGKGYYLLNRNPDTNHVGSKAWRKRSKALLAAHPEWME
jgi:hypothetical protein